MANFWERASPSIICSLHILTICNFSYFPFWFLGWDLGSDFSGQLLVTFCTLMQNFAACFAWLI